MSSRHRRVSSVDQEISAATSHNLQLQALIQLSSEAVVKDATAPSQATLQKCADDLAQARRLIIDAPASAKIRDEFRRSGGLEACVGVWRSVNTCFENGLQSRQECTLFFETLKRVLDVLAEALSAHAGNQDYFDSRVEGHGWSTLSELLRLSWSRIDASEFQELDRLNEKTRLLGLVFAFALCEETLAGFFRSFIVETGFEGKSSHLDEPSNEPRSQSPVEHEALKGLRAQVREKLTTKELLWFPNAAELVFNIANDNLSTVSKPETNLFLAIVITLSEVSRNSEYNLVSLHRTSLLSFIVNQVSNDEDATVRQLAIRELLLDLTKLGFSNLEDARRLFSLSLESDKCYDLLHAVVRGSRDPPHFHFDLSLHGYSSLELANVAGAFPHAEDAFGYTFMCWLRIDKFDNSCHTTLFGAFDESQTAFLLLYLESKSHQLVLQTSVTSSRPSTRFKSLVFKEGIWYHIAVVHQKGRGDATPAHLFVNGELSETVAARYPDHPMQSRVSLKASGSDSSASIRPTPLQAFFGTPHDLSPRVGQGTVSSKWSLASGYLLNDLIPSELILVYQKLGPYYHGNFQDCLGSFQTYQASAALNLINESLHPGNEESSPIFRAIHSKAGDLVSEKKFVIAVSAASTLDPKGSATHPGRSQLGMPAFHLPKSGSSNKITNRLAFNSAIPSIRQAIKIIGGTALLTGDTVIFKTKTLQDLAWSACGCTPLCLKLVEGAHSAHTFLAAVSTCFEMVRKSWRISEVMETEDGFGALAWLIRNKLQSLPKEYTTSDSEPPVSLSKALLMKILKFVGYNEKKPSASIIINPLAYRVLLVDSGIWQAVESRTQKLYYRQFKDFSSSVHGQFNCRRLTRMRIIKKLLAYFQSPGLDVDVIEDALQAFRSLLECTMSSEVLRAVALYVTYAVHVSEPQNTSARTPTGRTRALSLRSQQSGSEIAPERRLGTNESGMLILEMLTDMLCADHSYTFIYKLGKAVTNKWLLHLLSEPAPRVIICSVRILTLLLVSHGRSYIQKFDDKTKGFAILGQKLKMVWYLPAVLLSCIAILFGLDISFLKADKTLDPELVLQSIAHQGKANIFCPQILPVIGEVLQGAILSGTVAKPVENKNLDTQQLESNRNANLDVGMGAHSEIVTASQFLDTIRYLHTHLQSFRDFAIEYNWMRILLKSFFIAENKQLQPENIGSQEQYTIDEDFTEAKRPNTSQHVERKRTDLDSTASTHLNTPEPSQTFRRRASSFVVVRSGSTGPRAVSELSQPLRPRGVGLVAFEPTNPISDQLLQCIIDIFRDQVFCRKDFPGLGLFLKAPVSTIQDQARISSYIMVKILEYLKRMIVEDTTIFHDSRSLTNLARFLTQTCEALYEGWFVDESHMLLSFSGEILVHLQTNPAREAKGVRWSSVAVNSMKEVFVKCLIHSLSFATRNGPEDSWTTGIDHVRAHIAFALPSESSEELLNLSLLSLTYQLTNSDEESLARDAISLFRTLLQSRPEDCLGAFDHMGRSDSLSLAESMLEAAQESEDTLRSTVGKNRKALDVAFDALPNSTWDQFIAEENATRRRSAKIRLSKRKERLEELHLKELEELHALTEHEAANRNWVDNIQASERVRYLKTKQDQQESLAFHSATHARLCRRLERLSLTKRQENQGQWQLDDVEGHDRMRLHLSKVYTNQDVIYQPKNASQRLETPTTTAAPWKSFNRSSTPLIASQPETPPGERAAKGNNGSTAEGSSNDADTQMKTGDEDFEFVLKPPDDEQMDDKNRKVMRSLQRGEFVVDVLNATRIRGLGAWQTLLIIGKRSMYLLDHLFQRSDGEVVRADQAPKEERDPYMESLLDREKADNSDATVEVEAKHWPWHEIVSISKRHFLFRDVAIEIFFSDGRSCLLTLATTAARDSLYSSLLARATTIKYQVSSKREESAWRMEMLRNPRDAAQGLGAKFVNVFSQSTTPFTRQWMKGEMSNFHYLMMINTMAGRSFNDLTQYPVFPWVLADYTSDELDLTNPACFRDFTKPMGCQTPERESAFRDRYRSFAEMLDANTPAFHYGTHYSSAMIVSSYLMRLQPYVKSYLLLQGGRFDHPERLFSSIKKAWLSSSQETMTDVRELTPEFFYLPDFLTNVNGYDFGEKRDGSKIDDVELPPWSKGDPAIFIAKHREALESPYVSQNLHNWINLVFGSKQRGEAAIEATNVFHYLSYHGAKDLDTIEDEHEKLATIGIIHNFGQTPRQLFTRAHDKREEITPRFHDVVKALTAMRRLPGLACTINAPVSSLSISPKNQKVLASASNQAYLPPYFNALLEWGHTDHSIRFYATQHKPNVFEQLHQDQVSTALFADSKTLITASVDCTIAVWNLDNEQKILQLQPKGFLFGHVKPISSLAVSSALSTLVSVSTDGTVIVWDYNRLEKLRTLHQGPDVEYVQINNYNGQIFLCCRQAAYLYTLNGQLLLTQNLCSTPDDRIFCSAFVEPENEEWLGRDLIFTGHRRGGVNIWSLIVNKGSKWELQLLHRLQNTDQTRGDGFDYTSSITCILPKSHQVFVGDEDGRVSQWEFIR